jgi:alcohol dehydrogenase class IV
VNALAHCAAALYATSRAEETDPEVLAGAPLISRWLPVVVDSGHDLQARRGLLKGRCAPAPAFRKLLPVALAAAQHSVGRSQRDRRPVHQQRGVRMMPPQDRSAAAGCACTTC